jgi:hypothetical protein
VADFLDFVNSIADPTSRLNLADGTTWRVLRDGTRFDPPPLRRARRGGTMLIEGEPVSASVAGNRIIQLRLQLVAASNDAMAAQHQLLARELDREHNVLRWWPDGATSPVFFKTFRADGGGVEAVRLGLDRIELEIEAEPYALGALQTLSAATVNNNPAAGSNGMYCDITGVIGDVDTPIIVSIPSTDVVASGRRQSLFAVRQGGTPSNAPLAIQAESMTLAANTATQSNSSAWSGSGSNSVRASSLTSTLTTRLTSSVYPSSPAVDVRGTYRVFLRCAQTSGSDTMRARLDVSADGTNWLVGDPVTLPGGTAKRLVDLGLVQLPLGHTRRYGPDGAALSVGGAQFRIALARTSGSGSLDLDYLLFAPADDALGTVLWPGTSPTGLTTMRLDTTGPDPVVEGLSSGGAVLSTELVECDCGPIHISPGVTNRLVFALDVGSTSTAGDDVTETSSLTVSYYPRYLRVRPAST